MTGAVTQQQFFVLAAIVIAGFTALGWIILRLRDRIKKLSGGIDPSGDAAADLARRAMRLEARMDEMEPRLGVAEDAARTSIQKVGFLRFNPFPDTGGDQSFSIALLDRENNGVVISSLYMREGTRLYAKEVDGSTPRQPLSQEEARVLAEALRSSPRTL